MIFCDICDKKGMSQTSQFQICDILIFRSHDYGFFPVFLAKDNCHEHPTKRERERERERERDANVTHIWLFTHKAL